MRIETFQHVHSNRRDFKHRLNVLVPPADKTMLLQASNYLLHPRDMMLVHIKTAICQKGKPLVSLLPPPTLDFKLLTALTYNIS